MTDTWRYRFYQMQNGLPGFTSEVHLFDLPINQVQFSTKLNQVGTFMGTVQLSDPTVQAALLGQTSWPLLAERTAIYVELNGQLVWGGVLTQVKYQRTKHQMQIQGIDWWGYFAQGRLMSWDASYTATDQLYIAADLMNCAQGAPYSTSASGSYNIPGYVPSYTGVVGGNVGVLLGTVAQEALAGSYISGQNLTIAWAQSSNKQIGQAVSDVGTGASGFDWSIDVAYQNGVPTKTFNIWYPRAGRTQQTQEISGATVLFNMGGTSGQDYIWATGAVQCANTVYGAGSGTGTTGLTSTQANPNLLTQGWPLLENNISYTDIQSQTQLDSITLAYLNQVELPVSQPEVYYNAGSDSDQPLGSYAIGDDARLIIDPDDFYPSGYDSEGNSYGNQWWRIIQWTMNVNDQGKSFADIVFGTPPIIPGY